MYYCRAFRLKVMTKKAQNAKQKKGRENPAFS